MRLYTPLLLVFFAPGPALAYDTEPVELLFTDQVTLTEGALYQTGYLPDDSVGVNFALVTNQYVDVEMGALASLSWPEFVTLAITGLAETGHARTYANIGTEISFRLDLWGYVWEGMIDERSLQVVAEAFFDPLVLADSAPAVVELSDDGAGLEVYEISYTPISGVTLAVPIEISTSIDTTMAGIWIEHDDGSLQEGELDSVVMELPDDGYLAVESTYLAYWESALDLMLTPAIEVCVDFLGCYEVASFDIPITMQEIALEDPFEPVAFDFSLPVLVTPDDNHDFGEVALGTIANWNLELENLGATWLEGVVGISGSPYFSVYPNDVLAADAGRDGVVVSFLPDSTGEVTATLVFSSNDPVHPTYEILLRGTGVEPPDDGVAVIASEVGCGCNSSPDGGAALLSLLLPGIAIARRRRTSVAHSEVHPA